MKLLLLANAVFEGIAGLIMIFSAERLLNIASPETLVLARMYGFAALSLSILSFWMFRLSYSGELRLTGSTVLATFHSGICVTLLANPIFPLAISIIHGIFALAFIISIIGLGGALAKRERNNATP